MTGKEEEAFVPAQQEQRQNKAFDPFLTTTATRMETSTTSTRLGVFAETTLRADEKNNDSDDEMRQQRERSSSGSDNNLVISGTDRKFGLRT